MKLLVGEKLSLDQTNKVWWLLLGLPLRLEGVAHLPSKDTAFYISLFKHLHFTSASEKGGEIPTGLLFGFVFPFKSGVKGKRQ